MFCSKHEIINRQIRASKAKITHYLFMARYEVSYRNGNSYGKTVMNLKYGTPDEAKDEFLRRSSSYASIEVLGVERV